MYNYKLTDSSTTVKKQNKFYKINRDHDDLV